MPSQSFASRLSFSPKRGATTFKRSASTAPSQAGLRPSFRSRGLPAPMPASGNAAISGLPHTLGRATGASAEESGTGEGARAGDNPTQSGDQPGSHDSGTQLVFDGMGDVLSICRMQDAPATTGRMDPAQAPLCETEASETLQSHSRLSPESGRARMASLDTGTVWQRMVANGWKPASARRNDRGMVQKARTRKPD